VELGVSRERVDLLPKASMQTYLATYNDVDIALDSFPFVGGTTPAMPCGWACPSSHSWETGSAIAIPRAISSTRISGTGC